MVLYIAGGIVVLFLANDAREKNNFLLGTLILVSSIPHLLIFVIQGGLKNDRKYMYLGFAGIGIAIGIVTMFSTHLTLDKVCIMWGTFDICRSTFEIADVIPELKKHKWLELIDLAISLGEIAVAVFLIIEEFSGVKLHLVYFGITFIICGVKRIGENLYHHYSHEKSSDSN